MSLVTIDIHSLKHFLNGQMPEEQRIRVVTGLNQMHSHLERFIGFSMPIGCNPLYI